MDKNQFRNALNQETNNPQTIHGIFNWCDHWCERCKQTKHCSVYKISANLPSDNPKDFFKSLTTIFETTMDMLKEFSLKNDIDFESLEDNLDIKNEYDKEKQRILHDDGIILSKQYGKMVKRWLNLREKDALEMELHLQDTMLSECIEIIRWYQYLFEAKLTRALMTQKEEEKEGLNPYDSLGNAKLLLVSIERNISAWGYMYQKFKEYEDEILDILVCLQRLNKKIEQTFPEAHTFIRPGLD